MTLIEKNLSQCHIVHHKTDMGERERERERERETNKQTHKQTTNHNNTVAGITLSFT